jgi:transposase
MIGSTRRLSVFAYGKPVDMRKSFNTLSALVEQELGKDLLRGEIFLFLGRTRKRAKVLFWDGTGVCLFAKRLEKGRFADVWQRAATGALEMTLSELSLFLEGSVLIGEKSLSPSPYNLDTDGQVMRQSLSVFARARNESRPHQASRASSRT